MSFSERDGISDKDEGSAKQDVELTEVGETTEGVSSSSGVAKDSDASVEERKLVRKLDRRILPIICFMYLFACEQPFCFSCSLAQLMCFDHQSWTGPM